MKMSSSWEMQLIETANEELKILQTQYPNRFAFLKSDLQSFISDLSEDHAPPCPSSSSDVILTQESSNCKEKEKKKKRKYDEMENVKEQASSSSSKERSKRRITKREKNRVEMVIERAQLCIQKIRDVKASFS